MRNRPVIRLSNRQIKAAHLKASGGLRYGFGTPCLLGDAHLRRFADEVADKVISKYLRERNLK